MSVSLAPLTEAEVNQFVVEWYHNLDVHGPAQTFLDMVADTGIEFRFPEVTVTDKDGLAKWYQRVTNTFFDEEHTTKELAITIQDQGASAAVKIMTHWQCSAWNPPEPKSIRQVFLAGQTWSVKRSERTGKPVVVTYIVDSFVPVEGSAALQVKA